MFSMYCKIWKASYIAVKRWVIFASVIQRLSVIGTVGETICVTEDNTVCYDDGEIVINHKEPYQKKQILHWTYISKRVNKI